LSPALRLDAISLPILLLITFVGLIVTRFSRNYLDGDPRQPVFFTRLMLTLVPTAVLTLAGDLVVFALGWISLSLVLHGLLVFYPERPLAILAARKKFIAARLGDLCMIAAFVLLWTSAGTTDITAIQAAATANGLGGAGLAASLLIAMAALMKSAQFPFHGWITEVMETPTPVSALLHAGIVNAGGFAVLRFSGIIAESTPALWLLAMVGGGTALFASVVMLTQPRIKTQLAWSTIAQMGFMLLQCGLGAFSSTLLHILAHSLYKAHAFLWAGSAVETVHRLGPPASERAKPAAALAGYGAAAAIFGLVGAVATWLGAVEITPSLWVLGSVLVLGMGQMAATGLATGGGGKLMARIGAMMATASMAYMILQSGMA
jgi:NAD(P)H-quinone oxidoreductase subunit 5